MKRRKSEKDKKLANDARLLRWWRAWHREERDAADDVDESERAMDSGINAEDFHGHACGSRHNQHSSIGPV